MHEAKNMSYEAPAIAQADRPARKSRLAAGFAAGVVAAAGTGFLAAWILGRPSEEPAGGKRGGAGAPTADQAHAAAGEVAPEAAARIAELEARVRQDEGDATARRELAVLLVENERWVDSFAHARELLRAEADDPDGLYVSGVVRLRMGQNQEGVELLDRLLAAHPDHAEAWLAKGLGLLRSGDSEGAVAAWQQGLSAAGGSHAELERMLAVSRAALDEKARTSAVRLATAADAPPPAGEPASGAVAAASVAGYDVTVELPPGVDPPRSGTLFLSLAGEAGGPPVLVRRIASPRFPVVARLTESDAMLGGDLPRAGLVRARLDGDGNASTREPSDLEGSANGELGRSTKIALRLASEVTTGASG
jgi:tetratricopeptide (TPR) repeat protein